MIYVDTSVVVAHLLAEDRAPPPELWSEPLVSSRLLEYEAWTRLHALGLTRSHGATLRDALHRISLLEMNPLVLSRALEPFPAPIRTLDALHLASADFLRSQGVALRVASYDDRFLGAARKLGLGVADLP